MVDLSKFISIKKILSGVVVSIYNQVCCQLCQKCNYDKPKEFSMVKKNFVGNMHVMCAAEKLNGSTSLENDNMCYVSFRIWE